MTPEQITEIFPDIISQAINSLKKSLGITHANQLYNIVVKGALKHEGQDYIIESTFIEGHEKNMIIVYNIIMPSNDKVIIPADLKKLKTEFNLL